MAATTWTTLLPELKADICEILYDADPKSLVNLAVANKDCYAVASLFLFRTIKVFVRDRDQLQTRVQDYVKSLHRVGAHKHVRRLVIYGPGLHDSSATCSTSPYLVRTLYFDPDPERENDEDPFHSRLEKITGVDAYDNIYHSSFVPDASPVETAYKLDDWRPLADLVRQLPMLSDVIYQCSAQFPPCLLKALHERQPERPKCRLHLDSFKLRCLSTEPPTADPHELMLIKSPCLHSITIRTGRRTLHGSGHCVPQDQINLLFRLVAGLTPNLKEVHVFGMDGFPDVPLGPRYASFSPKWEGLLPIPRPGLQEKGSLSYLHLVGDFEFNGRDIDEWASCTDFTVLRTLRLDGLIEQEVIYALYARHSFPSLDALDICLNLDRIERLARLPEHFLWHCEDVEEFLCSLPTLQTLRMRNWVHSVSLQKVLGSNLKTLWLEPAMYSNEHITTEDIAQIREQCPLLENLTLGVVRSEGCVHETAVYTELGTLPKLRRLSLIMDPLRGDFKFSFTRGFQEREIGVVFVNSALDDTLAVAIFNVISAAKEQHNLAPLQKLDIRLVDADLSPDRTNLVFKIEKYIAMLGRSWVVERMPQDVTDSGPALVVREVNKEQYKRTKRRIDENIRGVGSRPGEQLPCLETIFRDIWPERSKGSALEDDWHSWPLTLSWGLRECYNQYCDERICNEWIDS
ncbi:hypothetical protein F4821DRAFT_221764 [Hypoxylon rubiginosum]|uniref:Uncharacterized protein n=1 Tax=Hypoxylon rubiginosum TaxID=110542 RepID=A0ACC0DM53_9PEZI|nr:hypothetical protein F4821DRAFT_221764 [Hypoxylon rubiginosum]